MMHVVSMRIGRLLKAWGALAAALLFVALPGSPASAAPSAPEAVRRTLPRAELEAYVDGLVYAARRALNIAGVEVAIVRDGQPILIKGYGFASSRPYRSVDPRRTLFRIGSISKMFTWILVMKEVERGRIRLADPVNRYLPDALKIPDAGFKRPVRIIDLMSHAPGLASASKGEFVADPTKFLSLEQRLLRQFPPRVREPGLVSSYSDQGTELAGYIVARLNGVDFETLAEREIFEPLGLTRTTFRQPYPPRPDLPRPMIEGLASDVSTGFGAAGLDVEPRPFEFTPAPSGSVSTTAADMARFMSLILNDGELDGVRIYSPATAEAFRTQIMPVPETVNGWAHGFMYYPLPGGYRGYGHSGGMLSFLSNLIVVPELNLGVFVTTNTNSGWGLADRLAGALIERFLLDGSELPRAGDPRFASEGWRFAARFASINRPTSGLAKFQYLIRTSGNALVTDAGLLQFAGRRWAPDGTRERFQAVDGHPRLYVSYGQDGRVSFIVDESGTGRSERLPWQFNKSLFIALGIATVLAGFSLVLASLLRWRQPAAGTPLERWSNRALTAAAALWLVFLAALAWWLSLGTLERVYGWPGPALKITSSSALLATCLSSGSLIAALLLWRQRGLWSWHRKLLFSLVAALFVAFGAVLAEWGALLPWAY